MAGGRNNICYIISIFIIIIIIIITEELYVRIAYVSSHSHRISVIIRHWGRKTSSKPSTRGTRYTKTWRIAALSP